GGGVRRRTAAQVLRAHGQGQGAARRPERVLEGHQHDRQPAWTMTMQKVIAINLNGNAYQVEEAGYNALMAYLDAALRQLRDNPDRDEIVPDLEQAVAEKCQRFLGAHKTVVSAAEVDQIIKEMGPVDGAADTAGASSANGATSPPRTAPGAPRRRRLYRMPDD